MLQKDLEIGLTYDDVLLLPGESDVMPNDVDLKTNLCDGVELAMPIVSAAMDTVTEARAAILMAQEGGIGVIHRNMTPEQQAKHVLQVKKSESGMVVNPITLSPNATVAEAIAIMRKKKISGFPVVENDQLVGILTARDLQFSEPSERPIRELMTQQEELVTVTENVTQEEARKRLHEHRIEKLLVVSDDGALVGLLTIRDIEKQRLHPNATKDDRGRLRVAAAVGVGADAVARTQALVEAGVDVIVLDTAHGHSKRVLEAVARTRAAYPDLPIVAGNIATAEAAEALIAAGANALKVGIGPGSICTTRIVAGIGVPQITAIRNVVDVARPKGITVIADGGLRYSGDVTKALAVGANCVMAGSLLAGTDESPGERILYQGRSYKVYRGMGSLGVLESAQSRDRYFQDDIGDGEGEAQKLVPEGVEGRVPYRGPLAAVLYQLLGGLRSGMGYVGAHSIEALYEKARFVRISPAALRESHVHDVIVTKESPNYHLD